VIDVALTRADVRPADVAVVIDVLRATSTVTQALDSGYRRVLCAATVEVALGLRAAGRVLAGERHCVMPPGFDQGNSPQEALDRRGDELVVATTNGAPAIVSAARHSPTVLLACLLNLDAVAAALVSDGAPRSGDIRLVCAGTDGAVALEDLYVAGRLSALLPGPRTDAAKAAEAVARAHARPLDALAASADADVLRAAGLETDIAFCARESALRIVPRVIEVRSDVALIALGARRASSAVPVDVADTVMA
jgi:2-phosphosulfolactate phosphatase